MISHQPEIIANDERSIAKSTIKKCISTSASVSGEFHHTNVVRYVTFVPELGTLFVRLWETINVAKEGSKYI